MEKKLFYCYSKRLKGFIESNGVPYVSKGTHPESKRPFYLYLKTQELNKVLDRWDEYKKMFDRI